MDKRQLVGAISLSIAVFALWYLFVGWYERTHPQPVANTPAAVQPSTTAPAATQTVNTINPTTQTTTTITASGLTAEEAVDQSAPNILLGSGTKQDGTYALQLTLTPMGAGIEDVTLNDFPSPSSANEKQGKKAAYHFQSPLQDAASTRVLATRLISINHKEIGLSNKRWNIGAVDAESAQFYIYINDPNGHVARVTKTFRIQKRDAKDGSKGYEVAVTQDIADARAAGPNGSAPLTVHSIINGPTPPPEEAQLGADRAVVVGYEKKSDISAESNTLNEFKKEESPPAHVEGTLDPAPVNKPANSIYTKPFAWIGQSSSYFSAVVLPATPGAPNFSARVSPVDTGNADEHSAALAFETTDQPVSATAASTTAMTVYFGPKWRNVLDTPYYEAYPRMYSKLLEIKSRMCAWATWDWLIYVLVSILRIFHHLLRDWGLSIICLVLIVRTLLHPITKRSQVQMMKMGKLTPEVEKLKKKYADEPDVLNREMMKLYKQQGGAILGCLPMFLQTPIWIALWSALQGTFELRQAPFLEIHSHALTWIHDLARPDTLLDLTRFNGGHPIPLIFGWHLWSVNLLPVLMAIVTYINQKYFMPMPIAATPEQVQQQKMQRGMSLFFPLMFYTMPSGLNLYYLTSMSLGILESKIIRDHIKEQEELAKIEGPEIVTTKPSRAARQKSDLSIADKAPAKPGLMDRLMEAMRKAQEQAEQMKNEKNNPDKGKGKKR